MANVPLKSIKFPGLSDTYTVPQVDNTLAVTGAAADAKKVGDELTDLKSAIFSEATNTLTIEMTNGAYVDATGASKSNANSAYTNYISVTGGATLTLNNVSLNSVRSVVAYSNNNSAAANKQRLDDGTTQSGQFVAVLPSWARYVRASTTKDTIITGSEYVRIDKVAKAIEDAETALDAVDDLDNKISASIRATETRSLCRATLTKPATFTGLDDITVFATALGYGVSAKPSNYKNTITTIVYVDATNGDDTNAGTEAAPLKTLFAAITSGADTVYLQNGTYTPPSSISASINLIGLGNAVIISGGASFTGDTTVYLENITFDGGCAFIVGASTETPTICANKCIFTNALNTGASSGNGLQIKGEATVRVFYCVAVNNYHDGFNYHKNTSISPASGAPNVLEVNCVAYGNGSTNSSPTSDNGTTAHNYTKIIRVNGSYHNNHGGNVSDNGNTLSWNVGCEAYESEQTTGNVNNADFWVNSYGVMYCENCYASGSTYDGWAEANSVIHVAGGEISVFHTDGTSSHDTFTSESTFEYVAG